MNQAAPLDRQPRHIGKYLARQAETGKSYDILPPHISDYFDRYAAIDAARNAGMIDPHNPIVQKSIREKLESDIDAFSERRRAERLLAEKVETWAAHYPDLVDVAYRLHQCRSSGTVGQRDDGSTVICWDEKCNLSKLCPDEARTEARRVEKKYMPHLHSWATASLFRQVFYAVFTIPNVPAGMLDLAQREIFDLFKGRILDAREEIPKSEREGRAKWRPMFPSIKGAFATIEAPLAADGRWNVHLNVVIPNDGYLDYAKLRAAWGHNLHISELEKDPLKLSATLREVLKYSVQIVPTKSAEKAARRSTAAPAMIEWEAHQFYEWWQAQKGFRRTRTYGVLYKVPALEDEEDSGPIQWLGTLKFCDAGHYCVDLIPADNFSGSYGRTPAENNYQHGPPDQYGPPGWLE